MFYEYECNDCGNIQEENHSMKESPEIKCNKCQKIMSRIISGGSGFKFMGGSPSGDLSFKTSMLKKNDKQRKKAQDHVKPITSLGQL
jgi:putative FmdB family regulatory protein